MAVLRRSIEKCAICGKPVEYEGDTYCYACGRRSELDELAASKENGDKD